MASPARLTKLYHELNRKFFRGRLPRYRVTLSSSIPSHGACLNDRRLIQLQRGLDPEMLRRLLLHEMCHIGTPYHGHRFQAKLYRLSAQGEAWAKDEAEKYRNAPSWNHEMANLRAKLDGVAFETGSKGPKFASLVAWLAHDLGLRPRELLRRSPWVRTAWKNACRDADRIDALMKKKHPVSRRDMAKSSREAQR